MNHINAVRCYLDLAISQLHARGVLHDRSEQESPEKEIFDRIGPHREPYGEPAYFRRLDELQGALNHHFEKNAHHPQHYLHGISGMSLLDLIEMLCDWKAASDADRATDYVDTADTIRVPLSEEELTATKREVDRGAVRIEKDVVAEERSIDVPVTEEEVHVTRRVVDRDVTGGETLFEGGTIEVPVRGEEVDVEKRARVTEELEVSKSAVQHTERVSDTVRREEARIVDDGNVLADDDDRPAR